MNKTYDSYGNPIPVVKSVCSEKVIVFLAGSLILTFVIVICLGLNNKFLKSEVNQRYYNDVKNWSNARPEIRQEVIDALADGQIRYYEYQSLANSFRDNAKAKAKDELKAKLREGKGQGQ